MKTRITVFLALIVLAAVFEKIFMGVTFGNLVAVNQASDTISSFTALHTYDGLRQWYWLIYFAIGIFTFYKPIRKEMKAKNGGDK